MDYFFQYGRMYELCKPRHERYKLALTKALISYMDAIVVDTDETAKTCVRHLKEQVRLTQNNWKDFIDLFSNSTSRLSCLCPVSRRRLSTTN